MSQQLLMKKIMALDFMQTDLALFLDTHPGDYEALVTHKEVANMAKKAKMEYEQAYGPLTMCNGCIKGAWNWIDDPWPWQKNANFNMRSGE